MDLKEAHELAEFVTQWQCPPQFVFVDRETGECSWLREDTFNELQQSGCRMYERFAVLHRYPEEK